MYVMYAAVYQIFEGLKSTGFLRQLSSSPFGGGLESH